MVLEIDKKNYKKMKFYYTFGWEMKQRFKIVIFRHICSKLFSYLKKKYEINNKWNNGATAKGMEKSMIANINKKKQVVHLNNYYN